MAGVRQQFTLGSRRHVSTPLQRVSANTLFQPRAAIYAPARGATGSLGVSSPVNQANPTSPAGTDPGLLPTLQHLQDWHYGKGR